MMPVASFVPAHEGRGDRRDDHQDRQDQQQPAEHIAQQLDEPIGLAGREQHEECQDGHDYDVTDSHHQKWMHDVLSPLGGLSRAARAC